MELKKSPKADLQTKKTMFFQIGLIISLFLVICVFGWSKGEVVLQEISAPEIIVEEEIIEITRDPEPVKQNTPRQAVQITSDILNIVRDDKKIEETFTFVDPLENMQVVFTPGTGNSDESYDDDMPFMTVEDMPLFMGGDVNNFRNWVQKQMNYPDVARENGIQGRVVLSIVIEKDGRVTNIEPLLSPDKSLTEEAIRIVKTSPKWTPGKQRGVPVRVKYSLPIDFVLN